MGASAPAPLNLGEHDMKKFIAILIGAAFALTVLATNYNSDTLESTDQSYDGLIQAKYFSFATGTSVLVTNDTVVLAEIPANAMIVDGEINVSAMGGAQTFDLGLKGADGSGYWTGTTADDVDYLLDGIACSNAVTDTFASLRAGDTIAAVELGARPVYLTITCPATASWTTNETIKGVVYYIEP